MAQRVRQARVARKLSQAQLALKSGLKQPDISKIEVGLIQKTTGIARLAQALDVSAAWLELGTGPAPEFAALFTGEQAHPATGLDHPLILTARETPPRLYWGEIKTVPTLPETFETELPDNAMAGAPLPCPKGTIVTFKRCTGIPYGEAVLVRDRRGGVYFRECRARADGGWTAHSYSPAFPTLDGEADGLEVLAVFDGVRGAWSALAR